MTATMRCLTAATALAGAAAAGQAVTPVAYQGWSKCFRVVSGDVELVAVSDIGPRILRLGRVGGPNLLKEFAEDLGRTGGDEWRPYGGHRLWHAPEASPRTYCPDNFPVSARVEGDRLTLTQGTEPMTAITKVMIVEPRSTGGFAITHRLTNHGIWPVELAPWALTMMAQGGFAIVPQEPFGPHPEHLLPARRLVLWPYTNMADPRWTWGERAILLRQDPAATSPTKAGYENHRGWVAYALGRQLFVKRYTYQEGAPYPDGGCSVETFTNADMLEVETLGPLVTLAPGASVEHVEWWDVLDDVPVEATEASVVAQVFPRVEALR